MVASLALVDSRKVLRQLATVDLRWLGLAFVLGLVQLALLGWRWSRIATALGLPLCWRKATSEYALSLLGNQVLPTGVAGDGLRGLRHSKDSNGAGLSKVFEALALDRLSGQLGLWLIIVAIAPLTISAGLVDGVSVVEATLACIAVLVGLWLVSTRLPWITARTQRAQGLLRRSVRFLLAPKSAATHLPPSFALVGCLLLQLWIAARAIGVELPLLQLLWLGPLIMVASSIPSFFGGWGIREGASALLFAGAGMGESTGVAVSVVYGTFALVISLPGVFVLLLDVDRAEASGEDVSSPGVASSGSLKDAE